jgi:hypothetical protein
VGITRSACDLPPEGGNHTSRDRVCGFRVRGFRLRCGFRLQAEVFLLVALLTGCAAHRPADDLTLSTQVKIEMLADREIGALRLQASTLNGVVTLSGDVPSQADADRAVAAARRVHGVRAVKSELKIAGS